MFLECTMGSVVILRCLVIDLFSRLSYIFQLSVDIFDFEAMYSSLSSLREVVAFYSWLARSCRNLLVIIRLYIAAFLGFDFVVLYSLLFG
jgi:hypothetical protein